MKAFIFKGLRFGKGNGFDVQFVTCKRLSIFPKETVFINLEFFSPRFSIIENQAAPTGKRLLITVSACG